MPKGLVSKAVSTDRYLEGPGGGQVADRGLILHNTRRRPPAASAGVSFCTFCPHRENSSVHPHFLSLMNISLPLPCPVRKHPCMATAKPLGLAGWPGWPGLAGWT